MSLRHELVVFLSWVDLFDLCFRTWFRLLLELDVFPAVVLILRLDS